MPQNRLRVEGGLAGRGRVRNHDSATEFQRRNQSPELWRQELHSSHHSQQRRRPAGTARQECDMLWSEGKPSLLRVPLSITGTRGPLSTAFPRPPQANTAGPDPPKRRGMLGNGSQVPPAALHQCRTTASHGWGEAGHTWGLAWGKSWPTASPRDTRPDSAVR